MSNPGMQIRETFERPSPELVDQFRGLAAANVADASNPMFAMHAGISPMGREKRLSGPDSRFPVFLFYSAGISFSQLSS